MGINITTPTVENRIRELSRLTGKGQTEVVAEAVDLMLSREKRRGLAYRLMAIAAETAPLMKDFDMEEAMYGENGLYDLEPVTAEQARIAREASRDFGRGSGHPAQLTFGDCFAYALAKGKAEPLLFKGDDFRHTDVLRAIP